MWPNNIFPNKTWKYSLAIAGFLTMLGATVLPDKRPSAVAPQLPSVSPVSEVAAPVFPEIPDVKPSPFAVRAVRHRRRVEVAPPVEPAVETPTDDSAEDVTGDVTE